MQHHSLILYFYTFLTLPFCFNMQPFKPVLSSLSGGASPHLFICGPLIMNETEDSEESWRSSHGIGPRVGVYSGDCAPFSGGNREEVLQCCISQCSPYKAEMSLTHTYDKPIHNKIDK